MNETRVGLVTKKLMPKAGWYLNSGSPGFTIIDALKVRETAPRERKNETQRLHLKKFNVFVCFMLLLFVCLFCFVLFYCCCFAVFVGGVQKKKKRILSTVM